MIRLWNAIKSGFYMTTSDDQLSRWTEKKLQSTSQAKLYQKKVMITVWWSAACPSHYTIQNPSEIITSEKYAWQIDEMHWKLQCLRLALVNRKGPILHNTRLHAVQPTLQKLNELGYEVLPYKVCAYVLLTLPWTFVNVFLHFGNKVGHEVLPHLTSCQLTTVSSNISTTFSMENVSITSRRQKMLSKSSWNPKAQTFTLQE